ncbi:MAG TPA: protein kinase [Bryobacteraceae bacterium]|nr:protein kinase [Bryobacteraceae bacterium]
MRLFAMIGRIDKYELKEELGRGGMGRVYRAYDPSLDHDVAIKVLTSEGDPDLLGRFRSEAGTTAKLNHKNIVTVHAYGEQDGVPYLVMELLQGEDLNQKMHGSKPLPLREKVQIMYQVAEGLSYAHDNNVIHRDIKPANIMVLPDGTVKIMDFGIARVTSRNSTRRTQKGFLLGTISYMAPEQFKLGLDADQLVDIFAYGDVFYELIAGLHPFHADDPGAVMYRITAMDPRPVRELVPECPESLSYIIHQLLAKDRELRYHSLRDTLLDLEPILFELRQEEAARILEEVQELVQAKTFDTALERVREALRLDPMSREARQVRDKLQQDVNRQAIRTKVTSLLREADTAVAEKRWADAIQICENALRLEPSDEVRGRLERAKGEQEKNQRAARLFADARRDAQQGNLTSASANIANALELDPNNSDIQYFSRRLRDDVAKRERERRVQEAVQSAAQHAAAGNFTVALDVLNAVGQEYAHLTEIVEARRQVLDLQAEAERVGRQRRYEETTAAVRTALRSGRLDDARHGIDRLFADFSEWPEAVRRANDFAEELARQRRETEIAVAEQEVRDLARQDRFAEARGKLEPLLARYPGDKKLQLVSEALAKVQAARERAEAITRTAEAIEHARREGRLEEALERARDAQRRFADHPGFPELTREIEAAVRERQRQAAIAGTLKQAAALAETDPEQAVNMLREAIAKLGREPDLQRALATAEALAEKRREQVFVSDILARSESLRASGQWRKALAEVERGIARYPQRAELLAASQEIRQELDRIAREERLAGAANAIERAVVKRDLGKAASLLKDALQEFGPDPRLERLRADIAKCEFEEARGAFENSVRQSFSRDDLEDAKRQISAAKKRFGSDAVWQALNVEQDRRQSYLGALQKAQELSDRGKFAEAEHVLGAATQIPIPDQRAEQLLRSIAKKRTKAEAEARERERQERERQEAEAREKARIEAERKAAEARERQEAERKAAEARARQEAEAREKARVEAERKAAEERGRQEAEAREKARLEAERKAAEERARQEAEAREKARLETERKAAEERGRQEAEAREKARLEAERKAAEERGRQEAEAREKARLETERKAAEERARQDAEAREKARLDAERKAAEERARQEAEAREKARLEAERKAAEERARQEAEAREKARLETERKAAEERGRQEAEAREKARLDAERKAAEARERERQEKERKDAEAREKARLDAERKAAEAREKARLDAERKAAEAREKERQEKERKATEARERERQDKQRKEAEARERTRLEAERKAAEARERQEAEAREAARLEAERKAAEQLGATAILKPTTRESLAVAPPPATAPSTVKTEPQPAPSQPIYRKPAVLAAGALILIAGGYFAFRPSAAPTAVNLRPTPAQVTLSYQEGSSATPSADIDFGGVDVPFQARSSAPWLTVSPATGQRLEKLQIKADPSGLKSGSSEARIEIVPSDAHKFALSNSTVAVRLTVGAASELHLEPTALQFAYQDGREVPAPKQISVPSGQLPSIQTRWEDPGEATWARAETSDGGLKVSIRPYRGLSVGTHNATLIVTLPGAKNSPQRVSVSLTVKSALGITIP